MFEPPEQYIPKQTTDHKTDEYNKHAFLDNLPQAKVKKLDKAITVLSGLDRLTYLIRERPLRLH